MAITRTAADLAGLDASSKDLVPVARLGGRVRAATGTIALAAADIDTDDDTVLVARIPSRAVIQQIWLWNDDLATTTANLQIGLYNTKTHLVVGNESSLGLLIGATANTTPINAYAPGVENVSKRLWELAGLASDPGGHFDVGFNSLAPAATLAGDLSWSITYTLD